MAVSHLGPLLSLLLSASPSVAQEVDRYVQLETDDAVIFMDAGGVAIRVQKTWACRRSNWPPENGADVYNRAQYLAFRNSRIELGNWSEWLCREQAGDVLWSRGIVEAQRKLNMSPDKKPCSPWVPETGQYNREMFEYSRCALAAEVEEARDSYWADMVLRLGPLLRMEPPSTSSDSERARFRAAVLAAAKERQLHESQAGCGRALETLHDYVECKMEGRKAELDGAEQRLLEFSRYVDSLPRGDRILGFQVREMQAQSDAVKQALQRVADIADGAL